MPRVRIRRGVAANLPSNNLLPGELLLTTDRGNLYAAVDVDEKVSVTPAIDTLPALPAINGDADLLIMHDADAVGRKEKKITFNAFKSALNIPEGSSDEKVAVAQGGSSGYLWGTDGTDGVLRMGGSMTWSKSADNSYVTLDVDVIDCGTF